MRKTTVRKFNKYAKENGWTKGQRRKAKKIYNSANIFEQAAIRSLLMS